jgi:hypothetical protein
MGFYARSQIWLIAIIGLKNAPSHFSKIIFQALGDFPFVKIYLDDIAIHSVDFTSHLHHIKQVLQRLTEVNLK